MDDMSGLASEILGSWKMTSWTYEVLETGEVKDALGKNPRGYINSSPDGGTMVLVLREDLRPRPLCRPPKKRWHFTIRCLRMPTYSVEKDRAIHRLDMSWNKTWDPLYPNRRSQPDLQIGSSKEPPRWSGLRFIRYNSKR
jgi:hypothetical protein